MLENELYKQEMLHLAVWNVVDKETASCRRFGGKNRFLRAARLPCLLTLSLLTPDTVVISQRIAASILVDVGPGASQAPETHGAECYSGLVNMPAVSLRF